MFRVIKTVIFVISIPICFLLVVFFTPNLSNGENIIYADKEYVKVEEPDNFVYYASQSSLSDGKMIGRDGFSVVYKLASDNIVFKKNIIGSNEIYRNSELPDLPNKLDLKFVTSLKLLGEPYLFKQVKLHNKNHTQIIEYLENSSQTEQDMILFDDISSDSYDCYMICVHCESLDGYYILGDLMISEKDCLYRPAGNMDKCYPIILNQIAQ